MGLTGCWLHVTLHSLDNTLPTLSFHLAWLAPCWRWLGVTRPLAPVYITAAAQLARWEDAGRLKEGSSLFNSLTQYHTLSMYMMLFLGPLSLFEATDNRLPPVAAAVTASIMHTFCRLLLHTLCRFPTFTCVLVFK